MTRIPPNLYTDAHWAQFIAWLGERQLVLRVPARGEPYAIELPKLPPVPVPAAWLKIIHDFCYGAAP